MKLFSIKNYYAFIPENLDEVPSVDFIPAKQRRRLSQNIRMSLASAHEVGGEKLRAVYATRYGEWGHTLKLLKEYRSEGEVSPMGFGLSVHNAAGGLFSLLNENTLPYTLVSAGEDSFSAGLLEALTQLESGPVLYVYSDEKTPEAYSGAMPPYPVGALALVLEKGGSFGWTVIEHAEDLGPSSFVEFLERDASSHQSGNLLLERA